VNKKWLRKYTETDPEKLKTKVSNYLSVRLDAQIHNALVQGRLQAWGNKSLSKFQEGPFDKIPADKWHEMEIAFRPMDDGRAHSITRDCGVGSYYGIKLNAKQISKEFRISKRALR